MIKFDDVWRDGIVSFDTCSLGRMYEWESKYAVNIKDALSYLLRVGKLWESEINIQEFSKQRTAIKESIYEQKYKKGIFNNLKKRPIPWNKIKGTLNRWEKKGFSEEFRQLIDEIYGNKGITEAQYNNIVEKSKSNTYDLDFEDLFDEILVPDEVVLTTDEKSELIHRYDSGVMCPGAEDSKKKNGNKYNDLYIWKLLQKKSEQEQKDMIFVTADTAKGDWFLEGKPHLKYLQEFKENTEHEIIILSLTDFWKECKRYLDMSVEQFIEISSIKDQLEEKYDVFNQEELFKAVGTFLYESDEIKTKLEDIVDCCVDEPELNELIGATITDIDMEYYDEENVYLTVYLQIETSFEACNHTAGEDWSAGSATMILLVSVLADVPVIWESDDTERLVLKDEIYVNEIADIKVLRIDEGVYEYDDECDEECEFEEDEGDYESDDEYF